MDGCSRQNPAYRFAKEKPRSGGAFLVRSRQAAVGRKARVAVLRTADCGLRSPSRVRHMSAAGNSFNSRATLTVGDRSFDCFRIDALQERYDVARLPFALKVLLENLLRNEDG